MSPFLIIFILLCVGIFLMPFIVRNIRTRFFWDTVNGVMLGIFIFLLVLLISNSNQVPLDLTKGGQFTLAEQSSKAVTNLKQPVKVLAFISDHTNKKQVEDLLDRYKRVDNAKFSYELVHMEKNPSKCKTYDVRQPNVAVVEVVTKDDKETPRREKANTITEDDLTNAMLKLSRTGEAKIYALTGHGEKDIADQNDAALALGKLKVDLFKEGLILEPLNLLKDKTIPADCRALLIAGPTAPLLPAEEKEISQYLKNQGRLLLALEPESPTEYNKLIAEYGIQVADKVVIDEASAQLTGEPVFALAQVFDPSHPVTKGFRQACLFELARPVEKTKDLPKDAVLAELAKTYPSCLTIPSSDVVGKKELRIEASNSQPVQVNLVIAGSYPTAANATPSPSPTPGKPEPKKPETRLIVVGDSNFLTNAFVKKLGDRDLALNMMNWLVETENQLSIRPKDPESPPLRLAGSEAATTVLIYVVVIPGLVAFSGLFLAWRRR